MPLMEDDFTVEEVATLKEEEKRVKERVKYLKENGCLLVPVEEHWNKEEAIEAFFKKWFSLRDESPNVVVDGSWEIAEFDERINLGVGWYVFGPGELVLGEAFKKEFGCRIKWEKK